MKFEFRSKQINMLIKEDLEKLNNPFYISDIQIEL